MILLLYFVYANDILSLSLSSSLSTRIYDLYDTRLCCAGVVVVAISADNMERNEYE